MHTVKATFLIVGAALASHASAQQPGNAEIARFDRARAAAVAAAPRIWPGFRPDTIPLQVVLPGRGTLMTGWGAAAPVGYTRMSSNRYWMNAADRGAASTAVAMNDRAVAQVVVGDEGANALAGLIAHEAFHVFEKSVARDGVKFGHGENSFYVSRYPVFDERNEATFALELALLVDALAAPTREAATQASRRYLAVRERRHGAMEANVGLFESMTELNEGLAEYALVMASAPGKASATAIERLRTVLTAAQSVRLRFYVTGMAQAVLLDRLGARDWKSQLMKRDVTLPEMLAEATGMNMASRYEAEARKLHNADGFERDAAARVSALRARVRARADSLMSVPGLKLILDGGGAPIPSCGFDPQNMLQLGDGGVLHTRWLKLCGRGVDLEFNVAVLQGGTLLQAVLPSISRSSITAAGSEIPSGSSPLEYRDIKLAGAVTGAVARAMVLRTADSIRITPIDK